MNSEQKKEILEKIKDNILKDNYQIEINKNRKDNYNFKREYELSDKELKEILLSIKEEDYYKTVNNYKKNYKNEKLHIFAPTIKLEKEDGKMEEIQLYTKFNIIEKKNM